MRTQRKVKWVMLFKKPGEAHWRLSCASITGTWEEAVEACAEVARYDGKKWRPTRWTIE